MRLTGAGSKPPSYFRKPLKDDLLRRVPKMGGQCPRPRALGLYKAPGR